MWKDLEYALRQLRRNLGFSAVAILTLTLGIGSSIAIFTLVNAVLLRALPYAQSDRLVCLLEQFPDGVSSIAYPNFLDWKSQQNSFEKLASWKTTDAPLTGGDTPVQMRVAEVTGEFFDTLKIRTILGRFLEPDDDKVGTPPLIVLSESLWKSRFGGDSQIVGKTVQLAERPYTVIGIAPSATAFPNNVEAWVSLGRQAQDGNYPRRDFHPGISALGRLKQGFNQQQAKADLDAIAVRLEQQYPDSNKARRVYVNSMLDEEVRNVRRTLLIFCGAVGFVLLIACANVANLLLARAASRQKEMSVRAALGADRWRIIRQLLIESIVLSFVGCGLGLVFAQVALTGIVATASGTIPRLHETRLDATVIVSALGMAFVTGLLFGLAPAWFSSRPDLQEGLNSSSRGNAGSQPRLRHALVIAEVALTLLLLVGAGLLMRSFLELNRVQPGYETEHTLTFRLGLTEPRYNTFARQVAFERAMIDRLRSIPGVRAASVSSKIPLDGDRSNFLFLIEGQPEPPPQDRPSMDVQSIGPGYFEALGIPILRGRGFTDADNRDHLVGTTNAETWMAGLRVGIIDDEFAKRYFPNGDALGKRIILPWDQRFPVEIVGIVPAIKSNTLDEISRKVRVYFPFRQTPQPRFSVIVKTKGEPTALLAAVRHELHSLDPQKPIYDIQTLEGMRNQSLAPQRFNFLLLGAFASAALALAVIGLYGVLAYAVAQRRREIGVRMALGAHVTDVMRMIVAHGLRLFAIGATLGLVAAFAFTRVMERLLFDVKPLDPITFASVTLLLIAVALFASFIPARKAARINPIESLRYE
jgi:putative ABC transport system permease protein